MALFVILCTFSYFEQMQLGFKMEKKFERATIELFNGQLNC